MQRKLETWRREEMVREWDDRGGKEELKSTAFSVLGLRRQGQHIIRGWKGGGGNRGGGYTQYMVRDGRFTHIRLQYEGVLVADLECLSPVSPPTRP